MKNPRFRIVFFFLVCLAIFGAASYGAYVVLFDHVLKRSEAWHLRVEEVHGTHPLELRITVDPDQGYLIIRSVTTKMHERELNVQYHLALSGLAKSEPYWGIPYTLTVP